jgi:hypothetical protein
MSAREFSEHLRAGLISPGTTSFEDEEEAQAALITVKLDPKWDGRASGKILQIWKHGDAVPRA